VFAERAVIGAISAIELLDVVSFRALVVVVMDVPVVRLD